MFFLLFRSTEFSVELFIKLKSYQTFRKSSRKMSGMLIGSSNVYRFYRSESFPTFKNYSMVRCTDIESFRAIMGNLEEDDKKVIVAVVENFLATGARDETTDKGRTEAMGKIVHDYC
jgi:hypothetical protein